MLRGWQGLAGMPNEHIWDKIGAVRTITAARGRGRVRLCALHDFVSALRGR
jgi:hypothetical protein